MQGFSVGSYYVMSIGIGILSVLTVVLTGLPTLDINVIPHFLRDILHVKLIDIVIIVSWVLLSILCIRCSLFQLKTKPNHTEFRMLFHRSFFGSQSNFFKSYVPICTLLFTPLTLWYIWTAIGYTYHHWTLGFAMILHALQLYPAILMIFQSTFQSCFLLWTYCLPDYWETVKTNDSGIQSVLREHVYLNLALAVHCVCLSMIASDKVSGLWWFSTGEIAYRLIAAVSLHYLINTACKNSVIATETTDTENKKSERV